MGHHLNRYRSSQSPFDRIRNVTEEGIEWWSGRELMPELGYKNWQAFLKVIERAKEHCRALAIDHSSIFIYANNNSQGVGRQSVDVQMTRYGCYIVAMCGDDSKPEVAAAKSYFAVQTRRAEQEIPTLGAVSAPPEPYGELPWSIRFRKTTASHFCYMTTHHQGFFSVVSAAVAHMLMMEEELIGHLLPTSSTDLPDGSIGWHWSKYRLAKGLLPSDVRAPLLLPNREKEAMVLIYPVGELGEFLSWIATSYLPEHLPKYYLNKAEFREYGSLTAASAADNACRKLTGRPANLKPSIRSQLITLNNFAPVGSRVPALASPQRFLFD